MAGDVVSRSIGQHVRVLEYQRVTTLVCGHAGLAAQLECKHVSM